MVAEKLQALERGDFKKLIVCMPPRHGKSTLIANYFPAWWIWKHPDDSVVLTTYEQGYASYWGGKTRELLESGSLGLAVRDGSSAKSFWHIKGREGGMASVGIGGPLTGKGAKLLIIDDVIKNAAEAQSKVVKAMHLDWYRTTASTRLDNENGRQVMCLTRWAEDDLPGTLMKEEGDWELLSLPALAEKDEYWPDGTLFRKQGEPLCPELFGVDALNKRRMEVGPVWWSALFQQNPMPACGTVFKLDWFKYFEEIEGKYVVDDAIVEPDGCRIFQAVDLATSLEHSDYSVIGTFAVTPQGDLLVLDIKKERIEAWRLADMICQNYRPEIGYIIIEATGFQTAFFQDVLRRGIPAKPIYPQRSKDLRAIPLASRMEQGKVFFRRGASWLPALRDELVSFPLGAHDDQVDVLAYAALEQAAGAVDLVPSIYK